MIPKQKAEELKERFKSQVIDVVDLMIEESDNFDTLEVTELSKSRRDFWILVQKELISN